EDAIKEGKFREDLYYRLNVVTIALPPLCERRQDIPALIEHFLTTRTIGAVRCQVHPDALRALENYSWPGNIRELANVLERAQIMAEEHLITLDDLPENLSGTAVEVPVAAAGTGDPRQLSAVERRHVQEVLRQEKG